jgi:asparagine synthase (glutamine-hydrolysing)
MSMAHSLEIRVPLLDDSMVNVALTLPASVRTKPGKALLSEAANIQKPNAKRPFALPFEAWMRGPLRDAVREGLLSSELPFNEAVPPEFRERLWHSFEAGRTHWSRPWAVAVLRLWPAANSFSWR